MIQQNGYIKCMKFIKYFSLEKITHTSTAATHRNNFHTLSIYNSKLPLIIATADPRVEWHYFLKNIQDIEMHDTCNKESHYGDQETLLWVS